MAIFPQNPIRRKERVVLDLEMCMKQIGLFRCVACRWLNINFNFMLIRATWVVHQSLQGLICPVWKSVLATTELPLQWVTVSLSRGKAVEPVTSSEVKNVWSWNSSHSYAFMTCKWTRLLLLDSNFYRLP
jgi:hypothetical protein